jgi:hypothetical protein
MEKDEQRFVIKYFWMKDWRAKRIHQERAATLGEDAYAVSQIKIWLRKFRNGDLSSKGVPDPGRRALTLERQLRTFLEEYRFASVRVIAQHFLTTIPTITSIFQRELGMKKCLWLLGPPLSNLGKLPESKHQRRCWRFYKDRKRINLKESQKVMSLGFDILVRPRKCLRDRQQRLF